MGEKALNNHTIETYITLEKESEIRYEYYDGFIVAMAGGTPAHGELSANLTTALSNALRSADKTCKVYSGDVKVAINKANRRVYPDASVVCGEVDTDTKEPNAITNPILITEVLSESTESLDRGEKFMAYRQLDSLREYLLVSQDKVMVEVFSRTDDGTWRIQSFPELSQEIDLPGLGISINTSDIYFGVEMDF